MTTTTPVRVLIIDDERDAAESLKLLVEMKDYLVKTASTGKEAIDVFEQWHPELVLVDMMLPDTDGLDLLRCFKEDRPEAEVIMVTGFGSVPKAVEAMNAGAFDFHREARGSPGAARCPRKGDRKGRAVGREPATQGGAARPDDVLEYRGAQRRDAAAVRSDPRRVADRCQRIDHGRKRHRQGARRNGHPPEQQARRSAVHQDQLRGDSERADRVRAVRPPQGGVHRGDFRQGGADGARRRRLAAARRDRRDAGRAAGETAARAAGA